MTNKSAHKDIYFYLLPRMNNIYFFKIHLISVDDLANIVNSNQYFTHINITKFVIYY